MEKPEIPGFFDLRRPLLDQYDPARLLPLPCHVCLECQHGREEETLAQVWGPSYASLFTQAARPFADQPATFDRFASASSFVVRHGGLPYLVTNFHVVTGRDPITDEPVKGNDRPHPSSLFVQHTRVESPTDWPTWDELRHDLYDQNEDARWLVHPSFGRHVDVVALPLQGVEGVSDRTYNLDDPMPSTQLTPASDVSIVGFPFGERTNGQVGVWSRGTIASEPDLPYHDLPAFLVDSRTRKGQSGSAVIRFSDGSPITLADGTVSVGREVYDLVGVYSGRISLDPPMRGGLGSAR